MAISQALYSSDKKNWETPAELFNELDREFGFNLDPAASDNNAKCEHYFTPEENGLREPWCLFVEGTTRAGRVFCNPPYGREVGKWVEKGCREAESGNAEVVAMLLPARTDTRWFHDYIYGRADEIRFLRGRLKFGGADNSAPFPSMVVVWRDR